MALPKKKKTFINIDPTPKGKKRQLELMVKTNPKTNFVPKGISLRDMDEAVRNEFKEEKLKFSIKRKNNDHPVKVFYLTTERWAEFSQTWQMMDSDKNLITPFITIKREGRPEYGDYALTKYKIPNNKKFLYIDVPNFDGEYINYKRYKISQPTPVQLNYSIKFFTKYQNELNAFDEKIMNMFSSRQLYVDIKGHYKPLTIEGSGDENMLSDKDGERLYVATYDMKLSGYLINEDDYEVVETNKKVNIIFRETRTDKKSRN